MASISDDPGGCKRILFMLDGKRRALRLGKATAKQADTVLSHVQEIIEAAMLGRSLDPLTAKWIAGLDVKMRGRMERAGLIRPTAGGAVALADLLAKFTATANVKD